MIEHIEPEDLYHEELLLLEKSDGLSEGKGLDAVTESLEYIRERIATHSRHTVVRHQFYLQQFLLNAHRSCENCFNNSGVVINDALRNFEAIEEYADWVPEQYAKYMRDKFDAAFAAEPEEPPLCLKDRLAEFQMNGYACAAYVSEDFRHLDESRLRAVARGRLRELGGIPWRLRGS